VVKKTIDVVQNEKDKHGLEGFWLLHEWVSMTFHINTFKPFISHIYVWTYKHIKQFVWINRVIMVEMLWEVSWSVEYLYDKSIQKLHICIGL